jgi:nucleotide-binding universal stress UspA family protein
MTTTLLVPLDGSAKDERALPAAEALADLAGASLHLIRVLDLPLETLSPRAQMMGAADEARARRHDMEVSVRGIADRIVADTGRSVTAEVAEGADVARVLLERATEQRPVLVVMATRAAGAIGRALRGSVADRVVRESPRPVVVVPPGADDIGGKQIRLRRVLVPLDGSALSFRAVEYLLALPRGGDLEYVLLRVIPPGPGAATASRIIPAWAEVMATAEANLGATDVTQARADAEQGLEAAAARLRAAGAKIVEVRVVEDADPAVAIAAAVRTELADFIAMSTGGASGIKRFVLGSVAEKVVRESDVPVLLVTPHD